VNLSSYIILPTIILLGKVDNFSIIGIFLLLLSMSVIYGEKKYILPLPVISLPFIANNILPNYDLVIFSISTVIAYYFEKVVYAYIALGVSLLIMNLPILPQFYIFIGLLLAYRLLNYDMRGIVGSGILLIVTASQLSQLQNQLSELAYYNLVFGVIGIIIEESRIKLSKKIYVPLTLSLYPLSTFLLPIPYEYYYWNPISYYFSQSPSNLWIAGLGYSPRLEKFGEYLLSHFLVYNLGQTIGAHTYIFIISYISSLSVYLFLGAYLQNTRIRILTSAVYSLLTPINSPSLAISYCLLPLALYLARKLSLINLSGFIIISLFSSSVVFPFITTASIFLFNLRREYAFFTFVSSLFWLIPYIILGFPEVTFPYNNPVLYILLTALTLITYFSERKGLSIFTVLLLSYCILNLPYSSYLYPVLILAILASSIYTKAKNYVLPTILILLTVLSSLQIAFSPTFNELSDYQIKALNSLSKMNFTTFYWNSSYPLLSPKPIVNDITLAQYIIYNFTFKPNIAYLGYPFNVSIITKKVINYTPPTPTNVINSNVTIIKDFARWIILNPSSTSAIAFFYSQPIYLNGTLKISMNVTDIKNFYIAIVDNYSRYRVYNNTLSIHVNYSVFRIYLYYTAKNPTIIALKIYYIHDNTSMNLLVPPTYYYKYIIQSKEVPNGIISLVKANSSIVLKFPKFSNVVFEVNGSEVKNSSLYLPAGVYLVSLKFTGLDLVRIGFESTILGIILSYLYVLFYSIKRLRERFTKIFDLKKRFTKKKA
jgi:hypothetical protein